MEHKVPRSLEICQGVSVNDGTELVASEVKGVRSQIPYVGGRDVTAQHLSDKQEGAFSLECLTEDMQRVQIREESQRCNNFASILSDTAHEELVFGLGSEGYNQLHLAAACGDLQSLISLIRFARYDRRKLDRRDAGGNTALHWALSEGHLEAACTLVLGGASVLVEDAEGVSALQQAVAQGNVSALQMLVHMARRVGTQPLSNSTVAAAIGRYTHEGVTGFHLAASSGNAQMLHVLKDIGVDVNVRDAKSGRTALHFCVEAGNEQLVDFLLTSVGVDPNVRTYSLHSALDLAEGRGLRKICELLKMHNAVNGCHEDTDSDYSDNAEM